MRVITIGTFDLFHAGHAALLWRAKKFGSVCVGLNTDAFVTRYKGTPPVMTYDERRQVLLACRDVAEIIPNDSEDIKGMVDRHMCDLIVVGTDWLKKDYYAQTGITDEWLIKTGRAIVFVPYTANISTSDIRRRLAER